MLRESLLRKQKAEYPLSKTDSAAGRLKSNKAGLCLSAQYAGRQLDHPQVEELKDDSEADEQVDDLNRRQTAKLDGKKEAAFLRNIPIRGDLADLRLDPDR